MITISVDDQINMAEEIVKLMQEIDPEGEHSSYSDAESAISYIKEKLPDVAWLDIEMPGVSGLELAGRIKKVSPETNIIFVTGHEKFAYQSYKLHASGFVLKPITKEDIERELDELRNPIVKDNKKKLLNVQCFGNFEVFDSSGEVVTFKRTNSKELLAFMIDRKGALCSVNEICTELFEDEEDEKRQKSKLRAWFSSLKEALKNVGAEDVIVKKWNAYGIDTSKVDCDYYNYLAGDRLAINSFQGEYMTQYSWAEMTLGELIMKGGDIYY